MWMKLKHGYFASPQKNIAPPHHRALVSPHLALPAGLTKFAAAAQILC
jgi:hypothetical protein